MNNTFCLILFALSLGCSRTTVKIGHDGGRPGPYGGLDGSTDSGADAGLDGGPPEELVLDCGRSEQFTSPRRRITLVATATSPADVTSQAWALVDQPRPSSPLVEPGPEGEVTLTPDVEGTYSMEFTATDTDGRSGSCQVTVQAVVGPPIAICPDEALTTFIDQPRLVMGDGFDDDEVVAYLWEVVVQPPESIPRLLRRRRPVVEFTSSTRGEYVLRLTVTDLDGATGSCDVAVTVTGPPEVECPDSPIRAPTRQPLTVRASATDDVGIASQRWELIDRPDGSAATPRPTDRLQTRLTPDRQGDYLLRYTATDVEGLSASCDVTVIGTPTPPDVTCPAVITTAPLVETRITATAVDDGEIRRWRWSLTSEPPGSDADPPRPRNEPTTVFTPQLAGIYELTVTVFDDDRQTASCVTRVEAGNVDGLRVEMAWSTNGTDMDLHLMKPEGTRWTSMDDCHFRNCTPGQTLDWGGPRLEDNPRLDIDDIDGFGPENINIETPELGSYRVAVHNWGGAGPNNVTVRIYCGGSTTTPRQTFGPVALRAATDDLWRVADVQITRTGCSITELIDASGRPDVRPLRRTQGMR